MLFPCFSNCGAVLNDYLKEQEITSLAKYFNQFPEENLFKKFVEVNKWMFASNSGSSSFYYQSDWYTWPLMIRPIFYFRESQTEKTSYIYFFGNPLVWWLGIVGLFGYFYLLIRNYLFKFKMKLPKSFYSRGSEFLVLGYLFYILPFASIPRFMLIYHYLPALVFSVILFSVFFEGVIKMIFKLSSDDNKLFFPNKKANLIFFGVLPLVFISFIFFSPLTYGFPLSEAEFKLRMWLDLWSF